MSALRSDGAIVGRLRRIGAAFAEALQLRYELVSLELREERSRLVGLLFQAVATALAFFMGFLCLNGLLLMWLWEERVVVAAAMAGFYLFVALVLFAMLRHRLRNQPTPFAGTIEELRKDAVALSSKS